MNPVGILVTGTDTGVGKTYVTAALAIKAREEGRTVGVMKPVETGCRPVRGGLARAMDAEFLAHMVGVTDPPEVICPERYRSPLAPWTAAEREGRRVSRTAIRNAYRDLASRYDQIFVEGAGGVAVPLDRGYLFSDLARELGLQAIVVARPALGTINHTVLTVEHLTGRGVPVLGVVFSKRAPGRLDAAGLTSPGVIEALCGVRILGTLGYVGRADRRSLLRAARGISL